MTHTKKNQLEDEVRVSQVSHFFVGQWKGFSATHKHWSIERPVTATCGSRVNPVFLAQVITIVSPSPRALVTLCDPKTVDYFDIYTQISSQSASTPTPPNLRLIWKLFLTLLLSFLWKKKVLEHVNVLVIKKQLKTLVISENEQVKRGEEKEWNIGNRIGNKKGDEKEKWERSLGSGVRDTP